MPHGRLTSLGKQLRCVLAHLSPRRAAPATCAIALRSSSTRPELCTKTIINSAIPAGHVFTRTKATADAAAAASEQDSAAAIDGGQLHNFRPIEASSAQEEQPSATASSKRIRIDHIGNALEAIGKGHLRYKPPAQAVDLTYIDPKSPYSIRDAAKRRSQYRPSDATEISLQSILGGYMTYSKRSDSLSADWQNAYIASEDEIEVEHLHRKGYTFEDVAAWADILGEEDSLEAAQKLAARISAHGVRAIPLFVYLDLLRRRNVSVQALQVLLHSARSIFFRRVKLSPNPDIVDPRFLAVVRLIRHARHVWPACMIDIVQLVLESRDQQGLEGVRLLSRKQLSLKSHQLNALLSLVSQSLNEHAFKHVEHQEAALVSILRYMSEHEPSLHINRQGYRAVIRIQLAQRKTSDEQQWAELKALSWPPWKEDRTGIDALITKDTHGMSRASQTLMRMREAGYRPLRWEQLAQIYAGWDIDGTPTIQRRVRLDGARRQHWKGSPGHEAQSAQWAARITSTRTVQEAWACYLAWEHKHLPPNQEVFRAIAIKLREELRRPHIERRRDLQAQRQKSWPLFPGDAKELSPLPPSTHLETYTPTRPPDLEDFYEALRGKNVKLRGSALAFIIQHARTLPCGLAVLCDSAELYPGINHILSRERTPELLRVPLTIFAAAVKLFSRFGEVPVLKELPHSTGVSLDNNDDVNQSSGVFHAIQLLRLRPESDRHMWDAVYSGLYREPNIVCFANGFLKQHSDQAEGAGTTAGMPEHIRRCAGAIQAFRLFRYVRNLQARNQVPLSTAAFYSFCIVTENRAAATWTVLQAAEVESYSPQMQQNVALFNKIVSSAKSVYRDGRSNGNDHDVYTSPPKLFDQVVGIRGGSTTDAAHLQGPTRLLTVPDPGVLHAYIRALGWLARHKNLLQLVEWMREYRTEILHRRRQDRNGDEMMRRAIIALRVFLERSWMPSPDAGIDYGVMNDGSEIAHTRRKLKAFRDSASEELINSVKIIVEDVDEWGGWPSDEEVQMYAAGKRFQPFRDHELKRNQRAGGQRANSTDIVA